MALTFYAASTISFIIQIVVLALLIGALILKNQKKFRQHGILMLTAVVLHLISIFVVMVPSLAAFFGSPDALSFADAYVSITAVHAFAGVISSVLGVWLVSAWHLQKDIQGCFRKKKVMDITFVLWLLSIVLGVILYLRIIQAI
ncbi:MAG: DUF420 domain-containing protein [Candidatus Bathyarchaeota archaeon]|nr:DUF420 domain-containing protein [Candidatus Bathyarchaeota archaeon]